MIQYFVQMDKNGCLIYFEYLKKIDFLYNVTYLTQR
jgi:hypothetical protein